jgi:dihydrofolate reductase
MKKIILSVAVSLDGFIEGPKGEYDWCPPPSEKEMAKFLDGIDTIFMGRKSYEVSGASMFLDKACYVFSSTLKSTSDKNVKFIGADVSKKIEEIKSGGGKDIWLYGGAQLTTSFINQRMVDEMWLGVVPIILGAGKPLFQNINERQKFSVSKAFNSSGYVSMQLKKV